MPGLLPEIDPEGLLEYSVVYTDRSLNHMSQRFIGVMQDILGTLKEVYHAHSAVIVPGSGTYGMEAVARQFTHGKKALIVRNGWFSFRWTQIFEMGGFASGTVVCQARQVGEGPQAPWQPPPVEEVVAAIRAERPAVVFAPHVETSSGILLPDAYLRAVADAAHEVGALFVLDCIASGTLWVDMQATGVDVLISAPQKGWSSSPCGAMVMLSERARQAIDGTTSSSFACDLKKWLQIAEGYEKGQAAYHATMPTDGLLRLHSAMAEARAIGFDALRARQVELGGKIRALLESKGFPSVAAEGYKASGVVVSYTTDPAEGYKASGVVVSYTTDPAIQNGQKFRALGLQIAAGVPLQCGEGAEFRTFRLGLFGLDKWQAVDRTVGSFAQALDQVLASA